MAKFLKTAALALTAPALVATSIPALATPSYDARYAQSSYGDRDGNDGWNHGRRDRGRYDESYGQRSYGGYESRGGYDEPVYRGTRTWRGDDGRNYCQHRDGTTGLLIGGAAGALVGREVAGRYGDRTLGAILGAVGGALVGRAIDKNGSRCR